jgi:hypothetical protein
MTSLLAPDPERLSLFNGFPRYCVVERKQEIRTHRLDEVREIDAMDYLKIDIQGGELDAMKHGLRLLQNAVVVQSEVSFVPLYRDQPPLGAIDTFLRTMGFIPHCFSELKIWPLAPMVVGGDPTRGIHQLLEADLVYVRDFTKPDGMDGEQWKHVALIAHHCYHSIDLAMHAVRMAAGLSAIAPDAPACYLKLLTDSKVPAF